MTVSNEIDRSGPYIGNGVTKAFDYDFRILDKSHLSVIRTEDGAETVLTVDADYTVSGVGSDEGGQITAAVAPTSAQSIVILRKVPFVQETDLENQGAYYAETVEKAFDLSVMRDQQLSERVDRALVIPAGGNSYDAGGKRVTNAAPGVGYDDLVTRAQLLDADGLASGILEDAIERAQDAATSAIDAKDQTASIRDETADLRNETEGFKNETSGIKDDTAGLVGGAVNARNDAQAAAAIAQAAALLYPDEATGRAAVADGAYFYVVGTAPVLATLYRRVNSGTSTLIRNIYNSAANIAFDPLFEVAAKSPGLSKAYSTAFGAVVRYPSPNSPWSKGGLYFNSANDLEMVFDNTSYSSLNIKSDDVLSARVVAHFANTGGSVVLFFKNSAGTNVGSTTTINAAGSGVQELNATVTVPTNATQLMVRVKNSGAKEVLGVAVAPGEMTPTFTAAPQPAGLFGAMRVGKNYWPDAWLRRYVAGHQTSGGFPTKWPSATIETLDASPFREKRVQRLVPKNFGTTEEVKVDLANLPLRLGDTVTCKLLVYCANSQAVKMHNFVRDGSNTVIVNTNAEVTPNGGFATLVIRWPVTQTVLDTGVSLTIRLQSGVTATETVDVVARAIYIGPDDPELFDDQYDLDQSFFADQALAASLLPQSQGLHNLVEYRYRGAFIKRAAGNGDNSVKQLNVGFFGDSYTHSHARYSRMLAKDIIAKYGDAGLGWFGFGAGLDGALKNGNVRNDIVSDVITGAWTGIYASTSSPSPSPDTCEAEATYTGAGNHARTITAAGGPVHNEAWLFWVGTSDGVVRYRWNGGSWTTLNVQGAVGDLHRASLSGVPNSGSWTFEIQVTAGTVRLAGVDFKNTTVKGARVHKLAATGSRLQSLALSSALASWKEGIQWLGLDTAQIMHGTNDQNGGRSTAQFATDMKTVSDNLRAANSVIDVFVVMPADNQGAYAGGMPAYSSALRALQVANKWAFLDMQNYFGYPPSVYADGSARPLYGSDSIHPNTAGGCLMVEILSRAYEGSV